MRKWLSAAASAVVGLALASFAAYGVVSSNTAAPSKNPVGNGSIINYGQK